MDTNLAQGKCQLIFLQGEKTRQAIPERQDRALWTTVQTVTARFSASNEVGSAMAATAVHCSYVMRQPTNLMLPTMSISSSFHSS